MQRPHHWNKQAALRGNDVHVYTLPKRLRFIARPSYYQDGPNVHRLPHSAIGGLLARFGNMAVANERRLERFEQYIESNVLERCGAGFDLVLYSSIPTARLRRVGSEGVLVYDCMDEWSGFAGASPSVSDWENNIASQADLILAVSEPLAIRLSKEHGGDKVMLVPNGCDYDLFASRSAPNSPHSGTGGRDAFVIGYVGTIGHWFDWGATQALADANPNATLLLVGPVEQAPASLPSNVRLEGRQPYSKVPDYVAQCDVCVIPFQEQAGKSLIAAVSPIKLYEYLASGKPVVTSPMPDTLRFAEQGIVHIARTPEEFVAQVEAAAALAGDPALVNRRRAIARQNSWSARWAQIEHRVREILVARMHD